MSWSVKLLKIRGIDIKIHLSFILIIVWAAYYWSSSTGEGLYGALFGIAAILLLFVAVTLHELGHSFQALKFGVKVHDITLMPMGGLARLEKIPEDPKQELNIAIAGPLVNFIIVGILFFVGLILQTRAVISLPELYTSLGQVSWSGMLAYLTMANLTLGLFNLIPAYPMDGGRILRSLLAMKLDYAQATNIATRIGQAFAWLFGLWGFLNGQWTLVLIAIIVWMGANHEGRHVEARSVLREYKVNQAMTRQPLTLLPEDPLGTAVELTLTTSQSDFPVVRSVDNELIGFLSEVDILKGLKSQGSDYPVGQLMQGDVITADEDESLYRVNQRMTANRIKSIPVVDPNKQLTGLLTASDITQAYQLLGFSMKQSKQTST